MATDDKVAFYLRHRPLIEEWAALREQAATGLEEGLVRAVGIVRRRPGTPKIIEDDSGRYPTYGINLEIPGAEPGDVWVALGWNRGELLKSGGASWPYMGIKIPRDTAKS